MDKQELIKSISWSYEGMYQMYRVTMNGEPVFSTKEAKERDMFIAELKAKIMLTDYEHH